MRLSPLLVMFLATEFCAAQAIRDVNAARTRANEFFRALDLRLDASEATGAVAELGAKKNARFTFTEPTGRFIVNVSEKGEVLSFVNGEVANEIFTRKAEQRQHNIGTESEAWAIGDSVIEATRINRSGLRHERYLDTFDSEDRNNQADRISLRYRETVGDYPGFVRETNVVLDGVSRKVEMFTSSLQYAYDAPTSTISRDEAVRVFKDIFAERRRYWESKDARAAERYGWPGDGAAASNMSLSVQQGGQACLGSEYGRILEETAKARLCWILTIQGTLTAIDAENKNPVACVLSKGEDSSARPRSALSEKGSVSERYPPVRYADYSPFGREGWPLTRNFLAEMASALAFFVLVRKVLLRHALSKRGKF